MYSANVFDLTMEGEIVDAVDMGAWLFHARLFDTLRFETAYTDWEIAKFSHRRR